MHFDRDAFEQTLSRSRARLLEAGAPGGHWVGELSSGALSTATAVFALHLVDARRHRGSIGRGLDWLARNSNPGGGWGDTVVSKSNLSTTALCWAALGACDTQGRYRAALAAGERWLGREVGSLEPESLAKALARRYRGDRTFSVPILTMCALAGGLGPASRAWRRVEALPFELAALPHSWLKWLRLPTVSYALPALIAVGQARYHHLPPANPLTRLVRRLARPRTLAALENIQPPGGGFLEASPLTAFVVMSLAASGRRDHPVVRRGVEFLIRSVRPDGSWPIDTNLATWVTTLSVNALAAGPEFSQHLPADRRGAIRRWLLAQQHRAEHPYTRAEPGGWAWTDLPGGVPDADDTAGALIALRKLGPADQRVMDAAAAGVRWLLGLQNRDGGIPTFCRGWAGLPFDRSSPDLTAHAVCALLTWRGAAPPRASRRLDRAIRRGAAFLARAQAADGSWVPLWFGNQFAPDEKNPTYGTARVLTALASTAARGLPGVQAMMSRGIEWLLSARNSDGGWGGAPAVPSSIEETALAVEALADALAEPPLADARAVRSALAGGVSWLIEHTGRGESMDPAPIGFYFARLWYFERLYPLIFTVSALGRAAKLLRSRRWC